MQSVPTPLIPAVRELARLHSPGRTQALLQGLQELIANIDSSGDIDIGADTEAARQLVERVEDLEERLAADSSVDSKSIAIAREKRLQLGTEARSSYGEAVKTGVSTCADAV